MTISSINTNAAALVATQNIDNANTATATEVAALSSGNRIVQASDDVAALSVGTALASQINTLNTALTVASQGSSLLQVADGALAQVQSILQQQQSIATQAQSGSLSSTQLGFLDEQFQSLTQQIDQLAGSTNFNGVNLLNGAIAGESTLATNALNGTTTAASVAVLSASAAAGNKETVTIDGYKVTFTTATAGTAAASGEVQSGATGASSLKNLAAFLNKAHAPQLANLQFTVNSAGTSLSAVYAGGALQGTLTITASTSTTAGVKPVAASVTIAGTTPAGQLENVQGVGISRYSYAGSISGTLLVSGGTGTNVGSAIDLTKVAGNTSFIGQFGTGTIGEITGTYVSADHASFSIQVGADTYTSGSVTLTGVNPQVIAFTGKNTAGTAAGGSFSLTLAGKAITAGSINGQSDVNTVASELNTALSGLTVYQNRTLTPASFKSGGLVLDSAGTQVANLDGAQVTFNGSDFSNVDLSSITVTAPTNGGTDATISAVINGDTYTSVAGIGNQIGTNTVIGLQDTSNPGNYLAIVTGNTGIASSSSTALNLGTQSDADLVQSALEQAFGLTNANASLSFQVGSATTDTIGVSIGSATSSALFGGQALDVKTQSDAASASNVLTTALNTVTALRASVGALEQRFTFATNAATSAAQNEGAAKSTLLDTDVASESTLFATSQVQLQAGIAVLAQANQLQQNLLKLIA